MTPVLLILWAGALTYPILAAPACSRPPQVPFATVDVFKAEYNVGEEITYQCNPGYIARSGSRKYICPLSGRWPSILLTCIPRKCLYPGPLVNGNIQHTDLSYPNSVNFSCDPGYNLQGPKTSHCQADGQWSAKLPQCQPVICPPPPVSEFSALLYHRFKPGNISVFQDKIKFDCLSPLALIGNEIAFCQADGSWSAIPECRPSCQIPVKRATVLYNDQKVKVQDHLQNGIRHAETIWFFCKNKEHHCSYTAPAQCIDGVLTPPECFKERSWFASVFKTDIADLTPCENIN
nr:beta-2-glycoprotein 1 isoform X2 [Pogona vitticeps]